MDMSLEQIATIVPDRITPDFLQMINDELSKS
jgi:hypothetical protein